MIRVHEGPDGIGTVFEVELPEARPVKPGEQSDEGDDRLEVA